MKVAERIALHRRTHYSDGLQHPQNVSDEYARALGKALAVGLRKSHWRQQISQVYPAVSVHLRSPSEHMIDGHKFAAELQILRKNQDMVLGLDEDDLLVPPMK